MAPATRQRGQNSATAEDLSIQAPARAVSGQNVNSSKKRAPQRNEEDSRMQLRSSQKRRPSSSQDIYEIPDDLVSEFQSDEVEKVAEFLLKLGHELNKDFGKPSQDTIKETTTEIAANAWYQVCSTKKEHLEARKETGTSLASFKTEQFRKNLKTACEDLLAHYEDIDTTTDVSSKLDTFKNVLSSIEFTKGSKPYEDAADDFFGLGIYLMVTVVQRALIRKAEVSLETGQVQHLEELIQVLQPVNEISKRVIRTRISPEDIFMVEFAKQYHVELQKIADHLMRFYRLRTSILTNAAFEDLNSKARNHRANEIMIESTWRREEIERRRQKMQQEMREQSGLDLRIHTGAVPQRRKEFSWDNEMDSQLLGLLMRYGYLPLSERYPKCLSHELFQNLSPQIIQKRALELKPAATATYNERGQYAPLWVSTIDVCPSFVSP